MEEKRPKYNGACRPLFRRPSAGVYDSYSSRDFLSGSHYIQGDRAVNVLLGENAAKCICLCVDGEIIHKELSSKLKRKKKTCYIFQRNILYSELLNNVERHLNFHVYKIVLDKENYKTR